MTRVMFRMAVYFYRVISHREIAILLIADPIGRFSMLLAPVQKSMKFNFLLACDIYIPEQYGHHFAEDTSR